MADVKEIRANRDALIEAKETTTTPEETVTALVSAIGYEKAREIIAIMVSAKGIWDQRISQKARAWAAEIASDFLGSNFVYYCDEIHPAHMDQIARAMMNTPEPAPEAEKEEPETMTPETIFPNLTAAVNAHFDNAAQKFRDKLDTIDCETVTGLWYWREKTTPAALRMIQEAAPADAIPEAAKKKMISRFTRENEKQRAKYLDKLAAAEAAPDPEYIAVNIEWKRNRTWGFNPTVEISGESVRTVDTASGCGYDKPSAATASAANAHREIMRILYKHAERGGEFPYSVYTYAGLPYFDGGCGMSCFYNVFEACGYRFKQTANGRHFEAYAITKGGANA